MDGKKHWNSEALVLLGKWLWDIGEYGHAMLCIHGASWGYKIGKQLSLTWSDVVDWETHECYEYVYTELSLNDRPINDLLKENIEYAHKFLGIKDDLQSLYVNHKTGKPLTSSTLNRELQRFAKQFIAHIKEQTGIDLSYLKELKTNAFEIAWAKDATKANKYNPKVYPLISRLMGHRTVQDTLDLLEEMPNDSYIHVGYNYLNEKTALLNPDLLRDKEALFRLVRSDIYYADISKVS